MLFRLKAIFKCREDQREKYIIDSERSNATLPAANCRLCCDSLGSQESNSILECPSCESVMTGTVPSNAVLARLYQSYSDGYTGGGVSRGRNQIRYARAYLRRVHRHSSCGKLLDVGCSTSPFPNLAAEVNFDTTVADFAKPVGLSADVQYLQGDLNSVTLLNSGQIYDVITAWAVIEHTGDPNHAFFIFAKLLKAGGHLHITTPEYGTVLTRGTAGRTNWLYPPEHLHLISPVAMRLIAARHGLRLSNWDRFELSSIRWVVRYGIGALETILGRSIKFLSPRLWQRLRTTKLSRFYGIAYYHFERT